jgi:hypothetical protein
MGYFDNIDNEFLKKLKKVYRCVFLDLDGHSNFMQFYYRLIVHQRLLNWNHYKLYKKLMVFDGLSNDNKII